MIIYSFRRILNILRIHVKIQSQSCDYFCFVLTAHIFYCLFSLFIHKVNMSLLYLWFSVLGYIVIVLHLELFLCLHVSLICALNYYLHTSRGISHPLAHVKSKRGNVRTGNPFPRKTGLAFQCFPVQTDPY